MRDKTKITPMTHKQIRAEFRKMNTENLRLKPCGLSFSEMVRNFTQK